MNGYYLVGLKRICQLLFSLATNRVENVLQETLESAHRHGLSVRLLKELDTEARVDTEPQSNVRPA